MAVIIALFLGWIPLPQRLSNGASCHDSADCQSDHCMCVGGPKGMLGYPNPQARDELRGWNGKPAAGACLSGPLMRGAWFCEVRHGNADFTGIIVD
ncbi:MAG TPA: hypothetical protein VGM88_24755 [Kofleriaceae bacterium]|jgi:hypothetical protein